MSYFPSRWPIMCAVMNGVSNLNLALAMHEAGVMPSLLVTGEHRCEKLNQDLSELVKCTGNANIVLSLDFYNLRDINLVKLVRQYKVSHIEFFGAFTSDKPTKEEFDDFMSDPMYAAGLKLIRETSKVSFRVFTPSDASNVDAYALKGSDAAGFSGKITTRELFDQQILRTPNMPLIVYGGVGTPEQVKYYVDHGAAGVAVGTLFAASKESCLADSTKQTMISTNSKSLIKFDTSQQALILGSADEIIADTELNRQSSLEKGIAGAGGHIYAGSSIDHVSEIRSVKEIVEYLTQLLH